MKSVLARLKDKKKNTVGEITDAMGVASLLKTEVLSEGTRYRRHRNALFTADTDCRE